MIDIDEGESNTCSMNPIAFVETTAAVRNAVLGALAKDPVVARPSPENSAGSRAG
jgi:hypothetical protein